jgi:hypothetical protein
LLDAADEQGESAVDRIARAGVEAAERGDFRFWKYLVDRIDGPVVSIEQHSDGLRPLIVRFVESDEG